MNPKTTTFIPKHPEKYVGDISSIVMRSSWERRFAKWVDLNPNVKKWGSESKAIPYFCSLDNKIHRYFPDFWILIEKNGELKRFIVEIKPFYQTQMPKKKNNQMTFIKECITYKRNMDKWKAAREYALKNNFEFLLITEKELGIDNC